MKSRVLVLVGLLLILAGLVRYGVAAQESGRAETAVKDSVPQLRQEMPKQIDVETAQDPTEEPKQEMPEVKIDGTVYIGIVEIPALELELPVISSWSNANAKIAPCRYSGSVIQEDLIVCAHNYDSHFGRLERLSGGDRVCFTDMEGIRYVYRVTELQTLESTDVEEMLSGDWDLTLFTCTPGGKRRIVIRCCSTE